MNKINEWLASEIVIVDSFDWPKTCLPMVKLVYQGVDDSLFQLVIWFDNTVKQGNRIVGVNFDVKSS